MYHAFLDIPYSFNWQNFIMQTAISSILGGLSSGIQARINQKDFWTGKKNIIPSQALETPSGKIKAAVAGMDRSKLTPNQLGKIGEDLAAAEMREQGIEVIKGHIAYRVEGVEGHGFTDVVGIKDNYIYYWEAKNGKKVNLTPFQRKAFPLLKKGAKIQFYGPNAIKNKLPLTPTNKYYFELKQYNIP